MNHELEEISGRLRALRRSRKLTLMQVQSQSKGDLHAVSLGSYERGDRALTVKKAIEIAAFYDVPLAYLLSGKETGVGINQKIVIDLRGLRAVGTLAQNHLTMKIIISFVTGIIKVRQDFNGEVLSLRDKDCEYLTITIGCTYREFQHYLLENKLLFTAK